MYVQTHRRDNRKTREYKARTLEITPDGNAYIMCDGPDGTWCDVALSAADIATLVRAAIVRSPNLGLILNIAA